ncbi:unnamed protein product [Cylindrotheca closterium]|uniref:Chalcone isomerase domain-containing protein n=1 Tax=Cylindrotheca closterium TaxID=2856 RepID=A0AAD2JL55_9STRA|nr:unnamed protein product [Cylindrotheca closterium]
MDAGEFFILIIVAILAYWFGANSVAPGISQGSGFLTDTATGINFPNSKTFAVNKGSMSLAGIGTRKKAFINIYSLGFYVSNPLQKQLTKAAASSSKTTTCETILESNQPKAVELTFAMGIGPEKIAEAIAQLANVKEEIKNEFHTMLLDGMGEGNMKKGESITFEWKGKDTILASARGKPIGEMKDKALAEGVLQLYLNKEKGVSPSLLQNMGCIRE